MLAPPPKLEDLRAGTKLVAGLGTSTIIADIDFETYSPAGSTWNPTKGRFEPLPGARVKGLAAVGVAVYSEDPGTEVLSCAYNLKDGNGTFLWKPERRLAPDNLFRHVNNGGLIEAWNVAFEHWIWMNVCVKKYGWPPIRLDQFRCAMAKSRAFALPGSLDAAGNVLNTTIRKDKDGKRLIDKFSVPRNPTKADARTRIVPADDPFDAAKLYQYNAVDIQAEAEISSRVPDLNSFELEFWKCDQAINYRGVQVDRAAVKACATIVEQAHAKYNRELQILTRGKVEAASEIQKLRNWMMEYGVSCPTLDAEVVTELLSIEGLPGDVRRALEIRELIGSAAVKKLYSMSNTLTRAGRIHDLFIYHSARTGRAAGAGAQPQNLPNSGLEVYRCGNPSCRKHFGKHLDSCPWCITNSAPFHKTEWNPEAVNDALETIAPGNLELVEYFFGDAIGTISGCLRGLFIAAPGKDLICSDYSAIEAVVLAALAGEEWRMEVFRTHGKIYEMSASKVCGIAFTDFLGYHQDNGKHHPMRKLGKVAELASGYQGWIGAWKQFGADEFFSDEDIKKSILAWRDASPAIVNFWGGQMRNWYPEYYGLEGAAVQAVMEPGKDFNYRGLTYVVVGDVLYCRLLSGRYLTYHRPRLAPSERKQDTFALSFEGWNTNPKNGAVGWIRMDTYGGKLTENVVQATARDILAHAIVNLEKSGYPVVLHVHDEIVAEIPEGFGSIEEFERIMASLPTWAETWPIRASGGWRGKRYTK